MARGTIHTVGENLFLVEGGWPDEPSARPGSAVLWSDQRLYLLDTGSGREQRSAVRAIIASFPAPAELMLINSGCHPGLIGNNDLLESSPAGGRIHVCHRCRRRTGAGAGGGICPSCQPTSRIGADVVELHEIAEPVMLRAGGTMWRGWRLPQVTAVEVPARTGRLAFWLPRQRALLLPDELALAPAWPGCNLADVRRVGEAVLDLLDAGTVEVLGLGFGGPLGAGPARTRIRELVDRGRDRGRAD